jgi:glycosyltransferase involved in cell wall biosynthesis
MSLNEIPKFNGKIFWTLHDVWPIGHFFHYPNKKNNLNNRYFNFLIKNKMKNLNKKPISLICPSDWMRKYALKNNLIKKSKSTIIRNPINFEFWKPLDIKTENKKIILFGSVDVFTDKRKGLNLFLSKLDKISKKIDDFKLLIFGGKYIEEKNYNFQIKNLGYLNKEQLRFFYNKADVYIVTSEQDNLPNTAIEAMACGTPVITVKNNGLKEIIINKKNGFVLEKFSNEELYKSINQSFKCKNKKVINKIIKKKLSEKEIVNKYLQFYKN